MAKKHNLEQNICSYERPPHNPKVVGSNPAPATIFKGKSVIYWFAFFLFCFLNFLSIHAAPNITWELWIASKINRNSVIINVLRLWG